MKLERITLLEKIGFSQAEIVNIEEFVAKLEEQQCWGEILCLAKEVMSVHPCGNLLRENLEKVESWEAKTGLHKYSLDLLLIIECALLLKKDYEQKLLEDERISMKIFYDSMKDITYKMHECQNVYDVQGIFVGFWYDGFFDMTRFALGRLQFEMMPLWLSEPVVVNGCKLENGMRAVNMHIPSCGPLMPKEADESLAFAASFFKENFRDHLVERPVVFVMASWLLDEDLMELLPEGNIKNFVTKFQVLNTNKSNYFDDGWRVFGRKWCFDEEKWRDEVGNLPRNTRLQRAIVDYLQRGGSIGYGYGVRIAEEITSVRV